MEVLYKKFGKKYSVNNSQNSGFVLSSGNGSFLNLGSKKNFSKFNGYFENLDGEIYKILESISLRTDKEIVRIEDFGSKYKRVYSSSYGMIKRVPLNSNVNGDIVGIDYSDNGGVEELVEVDKEISINESFFVGVTGGLMYSIDNYYGIVEINLDIRKDNDFSSFGRVYNIYKEGEYVIVEFIKTDKDEGNNIDKNKEYSVTAVFKIPNVKIKFNKEWIKKEYSYDKERGDNFEEYVYRGFSFKVVDYKNVFLGVGKTKDEAINNIRLLELHHVEMEKMQENFNDDLSSVNHFNKLVSDDIDHSYYLAHKNYYKFMNKKFNDSIENFYAGYPWFLQYWSRDTLLSLRPLINDNEIKISKKFLYNFFDMISNENGMLPVFEKAENYSLDSVFWLTKRFFDLFFKLDEQKSINKYFQDGELKIIYDKLHLIFNRIIVNKWDKNDELIKVEWGETWMDTIDRNYPLEIQVMFLDLLNSISVLAKYLNKNDDVERFQDLEFLMRANVREKYFRNGILYDEPFEDRVSVNVFLAYYFYPDLLFKEDWERVFDKSINHMWLPWGGFSSLSKKDSRFKGNYTGVNNESYHNGDSWFFMNNIAGICLYDFDSKKYKSHIDKIVKASKSDLLEQGFFGFGSEISSADEFAPKGCFAQLWSNATYIELIDKMYGKK